jgi:glycosyl transferase family 11
MAVSFSQLGTQGRLGNQLFQIAATVGLAIRNNDQYLFPSWKYENDFNLHGCFSNQIDTTEVYNELHFHYANIPYQPSLDLTGYYQSWKYWDDQKDFIRQILTPKVGFGIQWGYTGVHIRRSDYLSLRQEFAQLDMDYYRPAMEQMQSKRYIVFSDDIPWCKENFQKVNVEFSEGHSPAEDLSLLMACENQIIANSSFSWWAAWLNPNPSKKVIAPSKWFGPKLPHDTKDLLPADWTLI